MERKGEIMRVQGDVYCVRINDMPEGCTQLVKTNGRYVLAKKDVAENFRRVLPGL